jgi:tRNA modification GTPase
MNFHVDGATICALSTAGGAGAIAVIRVSGPQAIAICNDHFSGSLDETASHRVRFGRFIGDSGDLDEVLMTVFRGPKSFTGEDVVEIACHGSIFIQEQILQHLVKGGCRFAKQGEFTFRAFMNGKMDLSQAEAVADLIASETAGAHRLALDQMRGGFSREISLLREQLINFASLIELELDFSEEDVEFADRTAFKGLLQTIDTLLSGLIASFSTGNVIKNGVPVAIMGKPNAGKSTLLNAILNEERAIVSDIPGTTRDTIEDQITIDGVRYRFIDTAGLRETDDTIERIGVARSHAAMEKATVVLYLFDAGSTDLSQLDALHESVRAQLDLERQHLLMVGNKVDLLDHVPPTSPGLVWIGARDRAQLTDLYTALAQFAATDLVSQSRTVVTNIRHYEALVKSREALQAVSEGMEIGISGDFLAIDIRRALYHLGEITGEISSDDLLSNIFGKFCIGK